ncbi:hypothetical protein R50072_30520 [Simiduia litorea]
MNVSRSLVVFILVLLLGSANAMAVTLEAHLQKQSTLLSNKQASLDGLQAQLRSCNESEVDARDRLDQAMADVVDARVKLESVDTQSATQRELAQRSLALAEQGLESRQARLHRIEKKRSRIQNAIVEHRSFIARQQTLVASLRKQVIRQAAQAQREQKLSALVPSIDEEAMSFAATGEIEVMTSAALAADIARSESPLTYVRQTPLLSQQQKEARAEMQRLRELTKQADRARPEHGQAFEVVVNRELNIDLEYWGEGQYYAEIPLSAGKHLLEILRHAFTVSVPEENANDTYVIIYDTNPQRDARFVLFNQSLLEG